jgi:hypothetical protein
MVAKYKKRIDCKSSIASTHPADALRFGRWTSHQALHGLVTGSRLPAATDLKGDLAILPIAKRTTSTRLQDITNSLGCSIGQAWGNQRRVSHKIHEDHASLSDAHDES